MLQIFSFTGCFREIFIWFFSNQSAFQHLSHFTHLYTQSYTDGRSLCLASCQLADQVIRRFLMKASHHISTLSHSHIHSHIDETVIRAIWGSVSGPRIEPLTFWLVGDSHFLLNAPNSGNGELEGEENGRELRTVSYITHSIINNNREDREIEKNQQRAGVYRLKNNKTGVVEEMGSVNRPSIMSPQQVSRQTGKWNLQKIFIWSLKPCDMYQLISTTDLFRLVSQQVHAGTNRSVWIESSHRAWLSFLSKMPEGDGKWEVNSENCTGGTNFVRVR